jgi:hypothetical protein
MLTGTISDYDADGLFGLIDADDGRFVVFNLQSVDRPARDPFNVGTRVGFVEQVDSFGARACELSTTA